jgi:hypothetical protein
MRSLAAFALIYTSLASSAAIAAAPPTTTLCELASNPSKWAGRTVRLTATYMSDRLERDLFVDDRCPKVWFEPGDFRKGDRKSLEAFDRAVFGDGRSVRTTLFSVDMIGRVSFRRKGRSSGRITILHVLSYREFERPQAAPSAVKSITR